MGGVDPPSPNGTSHSSTASTLSTHAQSRPNRFLDILPSLLKSQPDTIPKLLLCGNSTAHWHACIAAYSKVDVEVAVAGTLGHEPLTTNGDAQRPCCPGYSSRRKLLTILRSATNASFVRVLHFRHPCFAHIPAACNDVTRVSDRAEAHHFASAVINLLPGLEELVWETGFGVDEELWKAIAGLPNLKRLHIVTPPLHPGLVDGAPSYPRITPTPQQLLPPGSEPSSDPAAISSGSAQAIGLGGLGLGVGWENLEELSLDGLSTTGARSLGSHFQIMASVADIHPPKLHTLSLSTHFADLRLCESIAQFGSLGSLRHITLGTTGTKLNAECVKVLIEESTALKSLHLNDVEGRLDKNTWADIDKWPASFETLVIDIAETGSHHSWVLKHLQSLHHLPFEQLRHFKVRRLLHPVATLPWPPPTVAASPVPPTHALEPMPFELLRAIAQGGDKLTDLCLDWWEIPFSHFEVLLKSSPHLRKLQVAVKAAMLDIVNMSTAFSHVPDLVELSIASAPVYSTAALKTKPSKAKKEQDPLDLPPLLLQRMEELDPTLLDSRDLRKFARRVPNLRILCWIGHDGKGQWTFTPSKKSTLTTIEFTHAAVLTKGIYEDCQRKPPSFEFDVESTHTPPALETPISPDQLLSAELPPLSLSRSTTGSSISLHTATTPQASGFLRRCSSTSAGVSSISDLGLEWDTPTNGGPPAPSASSSTWSRKSSGPPSPRCPEPPSTPATPRPRTSSPRSEPKVQTDKASRGSRGGSGRSRRESNRSGRVSGGGGGGKESGRSGGARGKVKDKDSSRSVPGSAKKEGKATPPAAAKKVQLPKQSDDGWTTVGKK